MTCIICGNQTKEQAPALISPWVRDLGIRDRLSTYHLCKICNTGFFSKRYDANEMAKIYENYRGKNYLKIRTHWEPWYSNSYNSNHDSWEWIESRKASLTQFLITNGVIRYETIVDIGGDRGQYIPDIADTKIVLDISDKSTLDSVTRYTTFESLPFADLIIYAHVLEHVSNPLEELKKLLSKSNYIYVEVPYGVPVINKARKSKIRLLAQLASSVSAPLWRRKTTPATGRVVSSRKMITQSEHLTFFSEESMIEIAKQINVKLVMQKTTISTPDLNSGQVLQCLLSRK